MFSGYSGQGYRNPGYDSQQVCLNGHIITNYAQTHPEDRKKFCTECGEAPILACKACNAHLKGAEIEPQVIVIGFGSTAPAYCYECGVAHPWTQRNFDTAMELAAQVETDESELAKFRDSLSNLATETPRTPLAVIRARTLLSKAGKVVGPAIGKILTEITTEAIQKQLGLK